MLEILGGVDGSGPRDNESNNAEYDRVFKNSHVKRLCGNAGRFSYSGYVRGPGDLGRETQGAANAITGWIEQKFMAVAVERARNPKLVLPDPRVFLTGFSRGGAAVVNACHQLKRKGIPVHCLMLFDAVDRARIGDTDEIPDNVSWAFHARRDPKAGSREMFGNCGTSAAPAVLYYEKFFLCTHGAVGGTPWDKVGKSGYIEELTSKQKAGIVAAGTAMGGVSGGIKAKNFADKNDFTKVTLEKDKKGAADSWAWMLGELNRIRHYTTSPKICQIRSFGKNYKR